MSDKWYSVHGMGPSKSLHPWDIWHGDEHFLQITATVDKVELIADALNSRDALTRTVAGLREKVAEGYRSRCADWPANRDRDRESYEYADRLIATLSTRQEAQDA